MSTLFPYNCLAFPTVMHVSHEDYVHYSPNFFRFTIARAIIYVNP